jgi:hypothetical protein
MLFAAERKFEDYFELAGLAEDEGAFGGDAVPGRPGSGGGAIAVDGSVALGGLVLGAL